MSTSLTSSTATYPSRLSGLPTKSQLSNASALPQYPTPPPTDANTAPRGKKRKITAPSIDTSTNKKSTSTRSPATATPTRGNPSTPSRGRQASVTTNGHSISSTNANNYPTRLSSAERNRRHIVSEEKRRKEGELERLRLSRLVPDALDLDRSEEQLLETTVEFLSDLLDDRRKLVEALESRGIEVGMGEFEGGAGREIWGDEKLMAELGDLEGLKAGINGGAPEDDGVENTPVDGPTIERPKPKRRKSKAKGNAPTSTVAAGAESSEQNNIDTTTTVTSAATAETPMTNPNLFDPDIFDISSYLPPALDDADDDAEARAAASSLVDFPSYG
ncbi:MAG: hypothetical protein Q9160_004974 [Pyrenula sp. 1 TL-2023]